METLSATSVDKAELDRLDGVVAALPADSPLGAALHYVSSNVRRGVAVTFTGEDEQVSPAVAARLLRMSRTHLYKLLDAGTISSVRVGRDRRIPIAALTEFERRRHDHRVELAERFANAEADRESLLDRLSE